MDRFDAMRTLLAAIEGGSLTAASRALGMPLATVSRKISDLESHLGTRLVVRTTRRLQLTEAGAHYVASARRILDDVEEAERLAMGEYRAPRGHLTITAPLMFGRLHVEPVVREFLQAYPEIDVRLVLADYVVNLIDDRVDAAVRIGALPDSTMVATRLGEVVWRVCASPAYIAARGAPDRARGCITARLRAVRRHIWNERVALWPGQGCSGRDGKAPPLGQFGRSGDRVGVRRAGDHPAAELSGARGDEAGQLVRLLGAFEPEPSPVHLVHTGQAILPLKLRAFWDFAAPRLRARIPQDT
jgi:DNA-binding transcriptional LysR family regulator